MRPRGVQLLCAVLLIGCIWQYQRFYAPRGHGRRSAVDGGGQPAQTQDIQAAAQGILAPTPESPTAEAAPSVAPASSSAALVPSSVAPAPGQRAKSPAQKPRETDPSQIDCTGISFFINPEPFKREFHSISDLSNFRDALGRFPCKVNSSEEAVFVMQWGYHTCNEAPELLRLPPRSPTRPYVVWWQCHRDNPELRARPDFIFCTFDLLDWNLANDSAPLLEGATIAPPKRAKFRGNPLVPAKYFVTFRGGINQRYHTTRADLAKSFKDYQKIRPDVHVYLNKPPQGAPSFWELADTTYALLPRGHSRWTYRFSETMGTCAIPVILANNWSLPFAPLVNWSEAAIFLDQRYAKNATELLSMLPTDPDVIRKMREKSCEIADRFFVTEEKRINGFLLSAKAVVAKRAQRLQGTSTAPPAR